jgi:hypothetical protein
MLHNHLSSIGPVAIHELSCVDEGETGLWFVCPLVAAEWARRAAEMAAERYGHGLNEPLQVLFGNPGSNDCVSPGDVELVVDNFWRHLKGEPPGIFSPWHRVETFPGKLSLATQAGLQVRLDHVFAIIFELPSIVETFFQFEDSLERLISLQALKG